MRLDSRGTRTVESNASHHTHDRPAKGRDELVEIYDDHAPQIERFDRLGQLLTGRFRERQFGSARGRVLDVACGTGENFPHLPEDVDLVGVDLSPRMLAGAKRRARDLGVEADLYRMDATSLEFPDDSFDTVISSFSTCTFPEPVETLTEMARVCRSDGRVLLLEHGRSSVDAIARFQDWYAPSHFENTGCRWNQEPVELVSHAPLEIREARRGVLGVLTAVEAVPADSAAESERERELATRLRETLSLLT